MSKPFMLLIALLAAGLVTACASPDDQYPISGEVCGPEDAVLDIDSSDLNCVPGA